MAFSRTKLASHHVRITCLHVIQGRNGQNGTPLHTTERATRDTMVAMGRPAGRNGPDRVAMRAP